MEENETNFQITGYEPSEKKPLGWDYEAQLCALYSIRWLLPENADTLWIAQNLKDDKIGKFDDIVICIRSKTNEKYAICMQTKHCEGKKVNVKLNLQDFKKKDAKGTGDFVIAKYYESVKANSTINILADVKKFYYILFTNRTLELTGIESKSCEAEFLDLLNTAEEKATTKTFQFKNFPEKSITDKDNFEEFLKLLFIYFNQLNLENLSMCIEKTIKVLLGVNNNECEEAVNNAKDKIITFFNEWAKGSLGGYRLLYKNEVLNVLSFYSLECYLTNDTFNNLEEPGGDDSKMQSLLCDIIFKRQLVVMRKGDASNKEFKQCKHFIMKAIQIIIKKYKGVIDDSVVYTDQEMSELQKAYSAISQTLTIKHSQKLHYILWIYKKIPIALDLNDESSFEQFQKLLPLCGTNKIIIFIDNTSSEFCMAQLENCLLNLSDLDDDSQSLILQQKMTFQGRNAKVQDVVFNEKIKAEISTLHIIQIIQEKFRIAESKLHILPSTFVKRTLKSIMVKVDTLNINNTINKFILVCETFEGFEEYIEDSRNKFNPINGVKIKNYIDNFDESNIEYDSKLFLIKDNNLKILKNALNTKERGVIYITLRLRKTPTAIYSISAENAYEQSVNIVALIDTKFITRSLRNFLDMHRIQYDQWDIYKHSDLDLRPPFNCKYIVTSDIKDFLFYKNLTRNHYCTFNFRYFVLRESNDKLVEWIPTSKHYVDLTRWIVKEKHKISSDVYSCYISDLSIISGSPGMGKSVLIDYLYTKGPSDMWIIPIILEAEATKFNKTSDDPMKLLKKIIRFDSFNILEKCIFNECFKSNKCLLLLDGFDEVVHLCGNEVTIFVRSMRNLNCKLLITTRPVQQSILERELSYFSRNINRFDVNDQKYYLKLFYAKIPNIKNSDNYDTIIDEFIDKVLKTSTDKMSAWDESFAGIPLQTYMIAKVYQDHCINYLENKLFEPEQVNILGLYKKFVDITIKHDKLKRLPTNVRCGVDIMKDSKDISLNPKIETDYQAYIKSTMKEYQLCALKYIFGDKFNPTELIRKKITKFIEEIKKGKENFGLVEKISDEGNPIFIHRTFAEYLIATYLEKHYLKKEKSEQILNLVFSDDVFDIIRNVMDRLLAGDNKKLHLAILNKNEDEIKDLLKTCKIDELDAGDRSAIDIASSWGARHRIPKPELLEGNHDNGYIYGSRQTKSSYHTHKDFPDKADKKGTEKILRLILDCHKDFEGFILESFTQILNFSIDCFALENTNYLLGYVDDKSIDVTESIERLLNKCSPSPSNMKFQQLLYICCMYDYNNIASQLIKLYSNSFNLKQINFGPYADDVFFVAGMYGSHRMLDLLISSVSENGEEYHALKVAASALRDSNNDNKLRDILTTAPKKRDVNGKSVLMYAAEWGCTKVVSRIIEREVIIGEKDNNEQSAPMLATRRERKEICEMFLKEACRTNDLETVNILINGNNNIVADLKETDQAPLMIAVEKNYVDIVKALLDAEADVNAMDKNKRTALMLATHKKSLEVATLLIEKSADVTVKDNHNKTPIIEAAQNKNAELVQLLIKHWPNEQASDLKKLVEKALLVIATKHNDEDTLKFLLEKKPDVNVFDASGNFPLKIAVENRYINIIDLLLKAKANVNKAARDGKTSLLIATENKDLKIMEKLIKAGGNVNAKDANGNTPLLLATKAAEADIVALLLQNQVDVTVKDQKGETAMQIATKSKHSDILKLLLDKNPNSHAAGSKMGNFDDTKRRKY